MSAEKQAFIDKYKDSAISACAGTGLFPSVMIAQAIVESGFGKTQLAYQYNNFFGIKADSSWNGEKVWLKNGKNDPNEYSYYRVYANAEDSFRDRCDFLQRQPRYTTHGVFTAQTPQEQIQAMKNARYAEAPNYVSAIMAEINHYGLAALDNIRGISTQTIQTVRKGKKIATKIAIIVIGVIVVICLYQIGIRYYPQYSISALWRKHK